jgi:hypothetical protein
VRLDTNYYRRNKEQIISGGEIDPRIATRDCERGTRITARIGTKNCERGTRITARIRTRLVKVGQEPMNRF